MKGTTNLIPPKLQPLPTRCVPITKGSRLVSEPLAPLCVCAISWQKSYNCFCCCHSCPQEHMPGLVYKLSLVTRWLLLKVQQIKDKKWNISLALALGPTCTTTSLANSVSKQVCINYSSFLATKETTMSFVGAPPSFRLVLPSDCRQTPGTNSPASQGIRTFFSSWPEVTFNTLDTWHHARNLIK